MLRILFPEARHLSNLSNAGHAKRKKLSAHCNIATISGFIVNFVALTTSLTQRVSPQLRPLNSDSENELLNPYFRNEGRAHRYEVYVKTMNCRRVENISALAFLCILLTNNLCAQERISLNQPVVRDVAGGKTESFPLPLKDGDYVSASVRPQGKLIVTILNPDRSIYRHFAAAGPDEQEFAFVAEGSGQYSIEITNAVEQPTKYTLVVKRLLTLSERLQPDPWIDPFSSPRIEALRRRITQDNPRTEDFWKQVAAEGTPLVETFDSDRKYQLVTFLWRAKHETKNVLVLGSFNQWGALSLDSSSMHPVGNSDVWYLTVKLPAGARFIYSLSPNDPMTNNGPRAGDRSATSQMDPFNSHRVNCPIGADKFTCSSVTELPQAPLQPWVLKTAVPEGRIEKGSIKSSIQNLDREFSIYLPPNYTSTGRPNALLILFDGVDYLSSEAQNRAPWGVPTILNNLIAARKIPPTVVVFINNVRGRRLLDLLADSNFADSVATELAPWVRSHYNVTKNPAETAVGGYSVGGFASAYLGLRHSEVFGNVMSQSGAFWWAPDHNGGVCGPDCRAAGYVPIPSLDTTTEPNWMAQQFLASRKLPLRFYLEAGTFEQDPRGRGGNILETTRHLRDVLRAKGYSVTYKQFVGGHDGLSWHGDLAEALIALLGSR
jgi:enterochelin esterase family protein